MTDSLIKTKWTVDKVHSMAQFKVKHLTISTVIGTFKTFHGELLGQGDSFDGAEVKFDIDANTLDTNHADRDKDLKSDTFLYTEKFPHIIFSGVLNLVEGDYKLQGDLTLKGITKAIVLDVDFGGLGKGRFGDIRAGFEVNGKINRKDFGITLNLLTETGGLVVGEEVKLHFDIQLIKSS